MDRAEGIREKKLAALGSVFAAVVLVGLKVFLTVSTGSLGVLSEALHSSLDFLAAIITYFSVRVSDRPADADHTYGHGKIENFSAFLETGLLLVTAAYIIWEAFQRLMFRRVEIHPSVTAVLILAVALAIDLARARSVGKVAQRYESDALAADALHFSTDIWSTSAVILGVVAVWLGQRTGVPWLIYADPVAALCVAGVIIWVGWLMGKRTIDALLDAAPRGLQGRITAAVEQLDGVLSADRVRVRRAGNHHFVDLTIAVPRTASFEQVHAISDAVERRVAELVPADVMVHMEPRADTRENLFDAVRAAAQRSGLAIHELSAHQLDGRLFVELHLEVDDHLSLRAAHDVATQFEESIRRELAHDAEINIHIEPLGTHISSAKEIKELSRAVQQYVNSLRDEFSELVDCHQVRVRNAEHKILVSCHCVMDGALSITEVHDATAALEDRIKEKFPHIYRVTIHPEPPEAS